MSRPPTPAPTPAVIAVGHTNIPLAELHPTAMGSPDRYSCTLVVTDAVVGHIIGRGSKGLHQAHDVSGTQLRAYTDKVSPAERRVSIRGIDQQIGDALIALGKCFIRKRVRPKKKGLSRPSEGTAPPPAGPAPAPPPASMNVNPRVPQRQAHPAAAKKPAQASPPMMLGTRHPFLRMQRAPLWARTPTPWSRRRYFYHAYTCHGISSSSPNSTPFAPSVTMLTPAPTNAAPTVPGSPMAIDAVATSEDKQESIGLALLQSRQRTKKKLHKAVHSGMEEKQK
ncbi:hypothetical protein GGX14DRAFT_408383 [Mycena pura]|uniref:K Homology domain-containing protein n=1 Tax=Mycena pura TaxID=153505 RepID=A0AAD6UQD0_9AGAR|nr:hypothetical protein GGX14DRAFT_408383 [Mycena pura]